MREIKFRMWDIKYKCVRYISDLFWFEENGVNSFFDDRYIFEQFTGLQDKNGKDIYEGDILRDPRTGDIGPVEWDEDWDEETPRFVWKHPKMYHELMKNTEIIGNIHERRQYDPH